MEPTKKDLMIARIKKLMRHAESAQKIGSLAEAETFSAKATELIQEYNIELHLLKFDEQEEDFSQYMYGESISYKDNQSGQRWKLNLVSVLCKHNFCNYTWKSYSKTFRVYGRMENVDSVVWLYNFLSTGLLRLAQEAHVNRTSEHIMMYGDRRYAFLKDYLIGAVVGIDRKLDRQKRESVHAEQITALMVVNKEALGKFLKSQDPTVRTVKMKPMRVGAAYRDGLVAGENYNINKPLATAKKVNILSN